MDRYKSNSILFANGNQSFLMYMGILVKRLGYKVLLARDGMEAISLAKEEKPTIIVLDYSIPKLNGISCLNMIRADSQLADTPVLMTWPANNGLSKNEIEAIDIQGYITTPLNINEFYSAIQKCLHHYKKRRHIRACLNINATLICNGEEKNLSALNLSVEGIFLRSSSPIPVGTDVSIVINIDDDGPIKLNGIVVSSNIKSEDISSESGMGIKFRNIQEGTKYRLRYFIMQQLTKDISVGNAARAWFDDSVTA